MAFAPEAERGRLDRLRRTAAAAAFAAMVLSLAIPAHAQSDDDLPARVGRIAEASGDIFIAPEDRANEWIPVGLNYPVTSGDNLWVGGEGRAEVDYGGGQFRLGGDTNLNVSRLDERQLALFIAQGRIVVRVRAIGPGESVRVDAPNAQIQLTRIGLYRIDVPPDRAMTTVSVREGEAQIAFPGGIQQALPGQSVFLAGAEPASADVRNAIQRDAFDAWSSNRDRYYEGGTAVEYVSADMVGYAELDHYGSWESYPDYGNVWFPTDVAPGWAPYSDGYWTSVGGWGNTWVDAAPWGYAPMHYGRWVWFGRRWGWCPGHVPAHPAWAPALVAWYGGAGWGASLGTRGPVYGWVPLGWREPYQPWWNRCGQRCWTRYNRPYAVTVPYAQRRAGPSPAYVNASVPGAISALAGATLPERKPVGPNRIALPARAIASAPLLAEAPPPVRQAPIDVASTRPGGRALPVPASVLRPAVPAGRVGGMPSALPARAQTPAPMQPSESRTRSPAAISLPPAAVANPSPTGIAAPANQGRAVTPAVPGQAPAREAAGNANAPAAKADGRSTVRTVPVPQSAPPAVGTSVPVPQSAQQYPSTGLPMPPPRSVPVQAVPNRGDVPQQATVVPQGAVQAPAQGVVPQAHVEGRAPPVAQHPKEVKEAPAPAGTSATPATPK